MSVDKFGYTPVTPYYNFQQNLDDLENVEGFNDVGGKDLIYGLKLNEEGFYERAPFPLNLGNPERNQNILYGLRLNERGVYERKQIDDLQIFDKDEVKPKTLLNIVYRNEKWSLLPAKHNWLINIKLKNSAVSCKGDSLELLRIYNSGTMLGNLVPLRTYIDTAILAIHNEEYCIAANKQQTVLEFVPKFERQRELLTDPPDGSTFIIQGYLLAPSPKQGITEGLHMKIGLINETIKFSIIVKKKKENFSLKTFPNDNDKLQVTLEGDLNLNKIKIYSGKYVITRIAFTTNPLTYEEIYYL